MEKSTHQVLTFRLPEPENHPQADRLKIFRIPDSSYVYLGNWDDWKEHVGKMVAWIPPEQLVDTRMQEFAFLASEAKYDENSGGPGPYARIKAKRLRGIVSFGLLTKVPDNVIEGENVTELLGIKHYEPEIAKEKNENCFMCGGEVAPAPEGIETPHYDVDAFLKYGKRVFIDGEPVVILEKLEGQNAAYVYSGGEYHCKSRYEWKREWSVPPNLTVDKLIEHLSIGDRKRAERGLPPPEVTVEERAKLIYEKSVTSFKAKQSVWWVALRNNEPLMKFLKDHPGVVVFGEQVGLHPKLHYGCKGNPQIYVFDILKDGRWMDWGEARELGKDLKWVPIIKENYLFNFDEIVKMVDGARSALAGHIIEGFCIRPIKERWDYKIGRVHLKVKNPVYLEKI